MPNLTIRPMQPSDAPYLYESVTHPQAYPYINMHPTAELSHTEEWVNNPARDQPRLVAVVDDRPVGSISLRGTNRPRITHNGNIGMNVHPDYWGQGIGSALMAAALDIADNWLNLVRVELDVFTHNERALRLYHKFGFEIEGTIRRRSFGNGRFLDAHLLARIRQPAQHPAPPPPPTIPRQQINLDDVHIRPFHPDYLPQFHHMMTQPQVALTTIQTTFTEPHEFAARMTPHIPGLHRLIAIHNDQLLGSISLLQPQAPRLLHTADLGMGVAPPFWGQGVGSKLMAHILDIADNWLNLRRVNLSVHTENPAAIRLYEKFGFQLEATKRYHVYGNGRWQHTHLMGRLHDPTY
ncbi:MAG TPA: GNAT family N-acetyltransferase [Anaerolineae bacterium]|nr:GNAT family N-acetyltransferase [Anaerolineae bacterium]